MPKALFAPFATVTLCSTNAATQAVQRNPVLVPPSQFDISPPAREMVPAERPGTSAFVHPLRPLRRPQHPLVVDPVVQSTFSSSWAPATRDIFSFPAHRFRTSTPTWP